jgi:hypothetical protein
VIFPRATGGVIFPIFVLERSRRLWNVSGAVLVPFLPHADGTLASFHPREHRRPVMLGNQQQRLHRGLPFVGIVIGLRQPGVVLPGVLQLDELATARQGIGSSNGRFQPLGELREEISALLHERQIRAGRMHRDPAVRDGGFNRSAVFLIAAASLSKLPVDGADLHPAGMVGLNPVGYLQQLAGGVVGIGELPRCDEFHGLGIP